PDGHPAGEGKYRFQWTAPLLISPHDPRVLYIGGNVLFKSVNEGQSWAPISPDLTRHDPATLGVSGGPITSDQTTAEYYATIFALAESPLRKGVLWAGSDDGLVHVTRDGGKTWTDVTPRDVAPFTRVSIIEAGHFAPGTAYLAANRYQLDDMAPYIYRTTDYGHSWTKIVRGIPATEFVRVVREDPVRRALLYAGTERGVWVSFDDGANWQSLRTNLPIVPVHDLAVKEGDLVAATHGRSFWILDDISPLRQLARAIPRESVHLFKPRDAYRVDWGGGFGGGGSDAHPVGKNPPSGARGEQGGPEHVRVEHALPRRSRVLGHGGRRDRRADGAAGRVPGAPARRRPDRDRAVRAQARSPRQGDPGRAARAVRLPATT